MKIENNEAKTAILPKTGIKNVNEKHLETLSFADKTALAVTNRVGSVGFFALILLWTFGWLTWNTLAPAAYRFDPFPGFVLWLFISNMIQIMLMPLIMIGQNLQSRHTELRTEAEFAINQKAEREIELILKHLKQQEETLAEILKKVEKTS